MTEYVADTELRIGIDLGGTKIEAVGIDGAGRELVRHRIGTPRDDYRTTLMAVVGLVRRIEQETGRTGTVGAGVPGSVSRATGMVKNANSTWLNGHPLDHDLSPGRAGTRGEGGERREAAWRYPRLQMSELLRAARSGIRGHPGHGVRRRHCDQRERACGTERSGGRVGPYSAAMGKGRRVSGAGVLLRAKRLPGDVGLGHRNSAGSPRGDREGTDGP